jgi:hypothetical protein
VQDVSECVALSLRRIMTGVRRIMRRIMRRIILASHYASLRRIMRRIIPLIDSGRSSKLSFAACWCTVRGGVHGTARWGS